MLKDKVKRLKKDVAGHMVCHEEKALSREGALAKFTGAFQVARLPLPAFPKDESVAAMFARVDRAIQGFERTAKENPGAKEPAAEKAEKKREEKKPAGDKKPS